MVMMTTMTPSQAALAVDSEKSSSHEEWEYWWDEPAPVDFSGWVSASWLGKHASVEACPDGRTTGARHTRLLPERV